MREVDEHAVEVIMQASKATASMVIQAMKQVLSKPVTAYKEVKHEHKLSRREQKRQKRNGPKTGSQRLSDLIKQGKQTSFVEIEDKKDLSRLKKELNFYNVDFSLVKEGKDNYHVFFKAQDAELMTLAMKKVIKGYDDKNLDDLEEEADKKEEKNAEKEEEKTSEKSSDEKPVDQEQEASEKEPDPPDDKPKEDKNDLVNEKQKSPSSEKGERSEKEAAPVDKGSQEPFNDLSGARTAQAKQTQSAPPTVRSRLEKAKKEAAAYNKSVKQSKDLVKKPKDKGVEK